MILSDKQLLSLIYPSKIDVFEGASGTGKSQLAKMKFITKVEESKRTQHFISGESAPTVRRNLIDDDLGILTMFPSVKEGKDPKKGNYLYLVDSNGRKKYIYIFGYGDSSKWKKVLGGTVGCGLIDEANLAPMNFITQVFRGLTRPTAEFWLGLTLNPTEPSSEIYNKLINKARPLEKYINDIPQSIIEELKKTTAVEDYIYWHFNHNDNPALTEEAVNALKNALLPGSPEWLSLIEGVRTSATGSIYAKYLNESFMYDDIKGFAPEGVKDFIYDKLDIGIDIGSGGINAKSVMALTGYKNIDGYNHVFNEDDYMCFEEASDELLDEWVNQIEIWWRLHGNRIDGIYVDGAGVSKTLILSLQDRLNANGIYIDVNVAWKFGKDGGIKARMFVMFALIHQKRIHFKRGNELYKMIKKLVRGEKTLIEDKNNLWNDYYDAWCYSWTHNTEEIR